MYKYYPFIALLIAGLLFFNSTTSQAAQSTAAKQALVLDYETGQILLEKNADTHMPTSSMSKVMTMYMVFDALKRGVITMETTFNVSENAWAKGGSKMFVPQGKDVKVIDLIRGVIVQSGNDATIVLAEGLSGSEEAFAKQMTNKALEIGMENSNFTNASGWPDPKHYSTAKDLALMARSMIENFPEYYKFYGETEFTFSNITQRNRNPLLYQNIGADGLKTGHTEVGGYGLIGTAVKDGRRVLMVINGLESEKDRASESIKLIEWALNGFVNKEILKAGQAIKRLPVAMGVQDTVGVGVDKDIKITLPRFVQDKYKIELQYQKPLIAPLAKGQKIGTIKIIIPDMPPRDYDLVTLEDVPKVGFIGGILFKIKNFVGNAI